MRKKNSLTARLKYNDKRKYIWQRKNLHPLPGKAAPPAGVHQGDPAPVVLPTAGGIDGAGCGVVIAAAAALLGPAVVLPVVLERKLLFWPWSWPSVWGDVPPAAGGCWMSPGSTKLWTTQ